MEQLPPEVQEKIESLENSVTEKQLAFKKLDEQLFGDNNSNDSSLLQLYLKAKKELNEAVETHISFFKSLTSSDPKN